MSNIHMGSPDEASLGGKEGLLKALYTLETQIEDTLNQWQGQVLTIVNAVKSLP